MGVILSKFRAKKVTSKERLEEIEKELRGIARFQIDTELKQKRIIGKIWVYSAFLYVFVAVGWYFWAPRGQPWLQSILYILPLIVFPFLMFLLKKGTTWYFQNKISNNRESYGELRKERERILEDVMENETFKVAKEILEKYAPKELLPKYLADQEKNNSMSPLPGLNTPANLQDLRRRQQFITPTPVRGGYTRPNLQSPVTRPMHSGPGQYLRQPTNAFPYGRPQLSIMGAPGSASRGPASSQMPTYMLPLPPTNPTMHNRGSGWMDKLVDYVVGDGAANRYALICRYCATHNGLATPEDFPFTGYRCVFCHQFNPPKEVRPTAPKLPVNQVLIEEMEQSPSTGKSDSSTVSDEGSTGGSRRGSGDASSKVKRDLRDGLDSETEDGPLITLADSPRNSESKPDEANSNDEANETTSTSFDQLAEFGSPVSVISLSEAASSKSPKEEAEVGSETEEISNAPQEGSKCDTNEAGDADANIEESREPSSEEKKES